MWRALNILPVVILLVSCLPFRSAGSDLFSQTPSVEAEPSRIVTDAPNGATLSAALTQFALIPTLTHIPTLTPEPRVTPAPILPLAQVGPITGPEVAFAGITFTVDPDLAESWSAITQAEGKPHNLAVVDDGEDAVSTDDIAPLEPPPGQMPLPTLKGDLCPECGEAAVINEEGCRKCYACGFSEC